MIDMKIERFEIGYQYFILPTIRITTDKFLNGYYAIELIWLKWGVEFKIK